MANEKISITAEFVSIIRAEKDPQNLYFVSEKGHKLYNIVRKIISQKKLKDIFSWRLKLSEKFDEKVTTESPEQIIELAAGYSLRGFNACLKNKNIIYIDSDLENVTSRKRGILENICRKENINFPSNYCLVTVDALKDNIFDKVRNLVSRDRKTFILVEGLTSYFSDLEFKKFLENVQLLLANFPSGEFYSHENIVQPTRGIIYYLLRRLFVSFLTKTKNRPGFKTSAEFENYLKSNNISRFKIYPDKLGLFYSIFRD